MAQKSQKDPITKRIDSSDEDVTALRDGYAKWRATGTIPDIVCGNTDVLVAVNAVDVQRPQFAYLFLAELASNEELHERAAQLYVTAFAHPSLKESQEFDDVDAACQLAELGELQDVLKNSHSNACSLVEKALLTRQSYYDRVKIEIALGRARLQTQLCEEVDESLRPDVIDVAHYIFERVKPEWSDKFHKALFWVNAEWVRRHGHTLVSAAPERWVNGPVYRDAETWLKLASDGGATPKSEVRGATIDIEMRSVLDQAIAHVSTNPCPDVIDEPLWIITAPNGVMTEKRMVMCYTGDPHGTLSKIFATVCPS